VISEAAGGEDHQGSRGGAEPDLIVVNGKVYTIDAAQARAEAFAVKTADLLPVGSSAAILVILRHGARKSSTPGR